MVDISRHGSVLLKVHLFSLVFKCHDHRWEVAATNSFRFKRIRIFGAGQSCPLTDPQGGHSAHTHTGR